MASRSKRTRSVSSRVPSKSLPRSAKAWEPLFTRGVKNAEALFSWRKFDCKIQDPTGRTYFEMAGVEAPDQWSSTAVEIAASKYFRRAGLPRRPQGETSVRLLVRRVVDFIEAEGLRQKVFRSSVEAKTFAEELRWVLLSQSGSFNSPVWFNAGLFKSYGVRSEGRRYAWDEKRGRIVERNEVFERPQTSACFIQKVDDDMESILDLLRKESLVFKYGSGSGTNFSSLRSKYETLLGGGHSSGLIAFLEVFDRAAGSIKSGGTTRRAAKMVILDVDHPEIEEFIQWKVREERKAKILASNGFGGGFESEAYRTVSGQNSNNSVRVTDAFMKAVEAGRSWQLLARDGKVLKEVPAQHIWDQLTAAAWETADPGLQFSDRIQQSHTCPHSGPIRASNPCSEYMFIDDSACNLASLNLLKFLTPEGHFQLKEFLHVARLLFWAQEILVDASSYPSSEIALNSHTHRPLGLGFAGFGALLMRLGVPYESDQGRSWGSHVASALAAAAWKASTELAERKGPFPAFPKNKKSCLQVLKQHQEAHESLKPADLNLEEIHGPLRELWQQVLERARRFGVRNAQATAIAPTGTIGLVMDSETTGIEPEYALLRIKNLSGGGVLRMASPSLRIALQKKGWSDLQILKLNQHLEQAGTLRGAPGLSEQDQKTFATALEISPEAHVAMMAAVQPFISGAISKTVNMRESATVKEVSQLYRLAWKSGLKSVAIYRDRSKGSQPLESSGKKLICPECGSSTELAGGCFRCLNCGSVVGCG